MRPADAARMLTLDQTEQAAFSTGLAFAWLTRAHFPDFYTMHVATRMTTYHDLLGVAGAFLGLAHQQLLALDTSAFASVPVKPSDPTEAFRHSLAGSSARYCLADQAQVWLSAPTPRTYGLGVDDVVPPGYTTRAPGDKHALALTLWRMVAPTPWARIQDDARTRTVITERLSDLELRRQILTRAPLPPATPLAALCARLDAERPGGMSSLGTALAYACGRTGNGFADHTRQELRHRGAGQLLRLDWWNTAAVFAQQRADQQAAAKWASAYSRLDGRVLKTPALLAELAAAITATAQAVLRSGDTGPGRTAAYDPRALINRLAFDERGTHEPEIDEAPHDGAEALAATPAAPVSA